MAHTCFPTREILFTLEENTVDSASIQISTQPLAFAGRWHPLKSDVLSSEELRAGDLVSIVEPQGERMRAAKLVQHMKANAERMSVEVTKKIRRSERCSEMATRLPLDEQERVAANIYRDLTAWLATESDETIEHRYIVMGLLRAQQGVPFSNLYWGVCIAQEHLWQYMQQECLLDEPVEFWGGVILLRSLTQFFSRVLYFVLLGYEQAATCEPKVPVARFAEGNS